MFPHSNKVSPRPTAATETGTWFVTDEFWAQVEPFLPTPPSHAKGGRPRADDRAIFSAVFYILRTGVQWRALPRIFGVASTTVHARFQEWVADGFFDRLHSAGLEAYDAAWGIVWRWLSVDGAMTKAPLGGEATGPNPTDRGKRGTKRSVVTDGRGEVLGIAAEGANRNDHLLLPATLDGIAVSRPRPTRRSPQHACLDKGYDYDSAREALRERGYTAHIRTRGEEQRDLRSIPGYRARRWVVERAHSWLNRYRRILVRWEKKASNYIAMLQLACANHAFRTAAKQVI
jgi:putative transposase